MEDFLAQTYPDRFSAATLKSTAQNVLTTWTKSGHLHGKVNKTRARAIATPAAAAYALYLSYLLGARADMLFRVALRGAARLPAGRSHRTSRHRRQPRLARLQAHRRRDRDPVPRSLTPQEREWLGE